MCRASTRGTGLVGWLIICLAIGLMTPQPARSVEPGEMLADPALETRARRLSAELRCLVCQNQSIDDSNAPLARDLRVLVRERLTAGDSDDQVMRFVVSRYGDFVLLRPPFNVSTLLLWLAPIVVLLGTVAAIALRMRARRAAALDVPALTEEERRALDALVAQPGRGDALARPERRSPKLS